jgi:tetraacyldisaccharide 4'-kinase
MPLSVLYGIGVSIHRLLYVTEVIKPLKFSLPILSVGNLSVGGSGKTPHVEFLIKYLKNYVTVGVLSRGYNRKSTGFIWVEPYLKSDEVGDEPLQIKSKFPEVSVAVCESRVSGVSEMVGINPGLQVIILDDAFQHRAIKPELDIVLTTFRQPFFSDYLLPTGRLREWRNAYRRADILIVSKCPNPLTEELRNDFIDKIKPQKYQKVYFSYFKYGKPYHLFHPEITIHLNRQVRVLLISAIAGVSYLEEYLKPKIDILVHKVFEDHHYFTQYEMTRLKATLDQMEGEKKIILTTEKDATRMWLHKDYLTAEDIAVFVLPVQVAFHGSDGAQFIEQIRQSLLDFQS